jgi:hypothetical protein
MKEGSSNEVVKETPVEAWTCTCGALLGRFQFDEAFNEMCLFIKHKDFYLVSKGGPESMIRRLCTKCGLTWCLSGSSLTEEGGEKV